MNQTKLKYFITIGVVVLTIIVVSILLLSKKSQPKDSQQRWFFNLEAENEIFRAPIGDRIGEVNLESCRGWGSRLLIETGPSNYYIDLKEKALYVLEQENFRLAKFTSSSVEIIELPKELHYKNRLLKDMRRSLGEDLGATESLIKKTEKSETIPGFIYCSRGPMDEPERVHFLIGKDGSLYFILEDYVRLFVYQLNKTQNKFIPILVDFKIETSDKILIDYDGTIWLQTYRDGNTVELKIDPRNGQIISEMLVKGDLVTVDETGNIYRREREKMYDIDWTLDKKNGKPYYVTITDLNTGAVVYRGDVKSPTHIKEIEKKYRQAEYLVVYNQQGEIIKKIDYDLRSQVFPDVFASKVSFSTKAAYDKESNSWVIRKETLNE